MPNSRSTSGYYIFKIAPLTGNNFPSKLCNWKAFLFTEVLRTSIVWILSFIMLNLTSTVFFRSATVNFQLLLMVPSTSLQKHLLTKIAKSRFQNQESVDFINELVIKIISRHMHFLLCHFANWITLNCEIKVRITDRRWNGHRKLRRNKSVKLRTSQQGLELQISNEESGQF